MTYIPHSSTNWRTPRVIPADITPTVIRLPDGRSFRGTLEIVSLTGGLLATTNLVQPGSRAKLMFLTRTGPVQGLAEILTPVSSTRQPFRFMAIEEEDQRRLRAVVQSSLDPGNEGWIEKYRAATIDRKPPRRKLFQALLGSLTLLTFLGTAAYLLDIHLR